MGKEEVKDNSRKNREEDSSESLNLDKKTLEKEGEVSSDKVVLEPEVYRTLKEKAQQKDELWDKYLRLYAEYENAQKLWSKKQEELLRFANFRLLKELVGILDEWEVALKNLDKLETEHFQGVEMIHKKFKEILFREGLKPIEIKDSKFDPHLHEVLSVEERADLEDYTILDVFQTGYLYKDKVLKPAKVKVSVKPREKKETENEKKSQNQKAQHNR